MRYEITAPERTYSGAVAGVQFSAGRAVLDTGWPKAAAALSYFRRRGYGVTAVSASLAGGTTESTAPAADDDGAASPENTAEAGGFNPGAHSVETVLAHLDDADPDDAARVLAAERAGKARKTILARAAEPGPDEQGDTTP